jgi:hypothetical protein
MAAQKSFNTTGGSSESINFRREAITADLPGARDAGSGTGFGEWISNLLGGIMAVAAILTFLYLLWGAVEWITSGGDKSKVESARNKITQAILGLIVLAATTALFILLQNFLGICVLDIGGSC